MMENGLKIDESAKMGASSNPNAARLAALQERRKTLEETINKRNSELKQLCIQEAELTGIMPPEIPLEPGESPPTFRRKVYTLYQLPQNLIDNLNKEEESITELELALQVQVKLAEAALGLANESNATKTVQRQHMQQYQKHKQNISALKDKLDYLKQRNQLATQMSSPTQQQKQKKKARPVEQEDSVSMNINLNDPFAKNTFRHSMRSLQNPIFSSNSTVADQRYVTNCMPPYRSKSTQLSESPSFVRQEDISTLASGIYGLSLNGYKNYVERQESTNDGQYIVSQSSPNLYHQYPQNYAAHHQRSISPYYSPTPGHANYDCKYKLSPHNQRQMSPNLNMNVNANVNVNMKQQYYPSHTISYQPGYRPYSSIDPNYRTISSHQLQPHQQYEHDVMTSGLGGFWKRTENGELSWVTNVSTTDSLQRNKRFGSLDRRKNKRVHKRTSPNVENKAATITSTHHYTDFQKVPAKIQNNVTNVLEDNRQLVRTQSLGSVGVQTVDSVWPSDDNSSCESDAHSFNDTNVTLKKQKQKEWYETSLDGPAVVQSPKVYPTTSIAPEEKYNTDYAPQQPQLQPQSHPQPVASSPIQIPKPALEIPAESNPSPRVQETNLKIFNNNIPKNCTIVQQGQWKPYHEETKPFEMSDFYKYSTKYKKSPSKSESSDRSDGMRSRSQSIGYWQYSSPQGRQQQQQQQQQQQNDNYDEDNASIICKSVYQPLQPMKCQPYSPVNSNNQSIRSVGSPMSLNNSLDLQLSSNVAENFSAEMNAWYQNHEQQSGNNNHNNNNNNNNTSSSSQLGKQRSTATLV